MYYGCSVCGFKTINNHSDLVQNKAMRYFLGVNKLTPIAALQGEMGWHPSIYGKYLCMLRLWNRIIKLPNDRLTKSIFTVDYERSSLNKNWCSDIKTVFEQLDRVEILCSKAICNISECKSKMTDIAALEWTQIIQDKPKLRTYVQFKISMIVSDYVKNSTNRYKRSILAKFRSGILQLRIESGRYSNTKVEERLCELCNLNEVEY